jgi:hypothetical protein
MVMCAALSKTCKVTFGKHLYSGGVHLFTPKGEVFPVLNKLIENVMKTYMGERRYSLTTKYR